MLQVVVKNHGARQKSTEHPMLLDIQSYDRIALVSMANPDQLLVYWFVPAVLSELSNLVHTVALALSDLFNRWTEIFTHHDQ